MSDDAPSTHHSPGHALSIERVLEIVDSTADRLNRTERRCEVPAPRTQPLAGISRYSSSGRRRL